MKETTGSGQHRNLSSDSASVPRSALEQRILAFVAEQTGADPECLTLNSRLLQDIGVDGDDAVELFQKFEDRYEVDLTSLYENWGQYFGSEAFIPRIHFIVAAGAATILGQFLNLAYRPVPAWTWVIVLFVGYLVVHAKYFSEPPGFIPITVQELLDAAVSRRWGQQCEWDESLPAPPRDPS